MPAERTARKAPTQRVAPVKAKPKKKQSVARPDRTGVERVARGSVSDFARLVEKAVEFKKIPGILDGKRTQKSCQKITAVNVGDLQMTQAVRAILDVSHAKPVYTKPHRYVVQRLIEPSFTTYHPELVEKCIDHILSICPNTKTIYFGGKYKHFHTDSWVFHRTTTGGHIDLVRYAKGSLLKPPRTDEIDLPFSPSNNYTLDCRLNLELHSEPPPPLYVMCCQKHKAPPKPPTAENLTLWRAALVESPIFSELGPAIDTGKLPISLGDLVRLYERQEEFGYADGLAMIIAPRLESFSLPQFTSFANIAGATLTHLELLNDRDAQSGFKSKISFQQLDTIISTVRSTLPNLTNFDISVKDDVSVAEASALGWLTPSSLDDGGTVKALRVFVDSRRIPDSLFNLIRYVSRVCTPDARISIDYYGYFEKMNALQGAYLRYLRSQSQGGRKYLSTVDFATLGVTKLKQVQKLEYDGQWVPLKLEE